MSMEQIASAITVILAVSVAVERVTEILKQIIPGFAEEKANPAAENRRRASLQVLAGAIGTVVAWQGNLQIASQTGVPAYLLIGAMSSGGSAFWNNVLDAVRATKISRQAQADEKVVIAKQMKAAAARTVAAGTAAPANSPAV